MKKFFLVICLFFLFNVFFSSGIMAAQVMDDQAEDVLTSELDNPIGNEDTDVYDVIGRIVRAFLGILGSISLVIFIYAGFMLLTSMGNPEKIKKGQQTMVWASLGILVVFASYTLLSFIFSAFGL